MNMKTLLKIVLSVLLLLPFTYRSYGQSALTELSYDTFLEECINFKAQNRQEVWVVFFWSSQNSKSLYDIPSLNRLMAAYRNKPVRFVSISEDKNENVWRSAIRTHNIPGEHIMVDRSSNLKNLKRAFPYNSLPGIFMVARDGKVWHPYTMNGLSDLLAQETRYLPQRSYYFNNTPISQPTASNDPDPFTPEPVFKDPDGNNIDGWVTHIVKKGETLYRLQVKYGVPVDELRRLNGLSSNNIKVGQVIRIRRT